MAVPATPLTLTVELKDMKLGEMRMLHPANMGLALMDGRFLAFMLKYSNWTAAEIDDLTFGEMQDISAQIGKKIADSAVPKVNAPDSEPGPG